MTLHEIADALRPLAEKLNAEPTLSPVANLIHVNLCFLMSVIEEVPDSEREECVKVLAETALLTMMQVLSHYHGHPESPRNLLAHHAILKHGES